LPADEIHQVLLTLVRCTSQFSGWHREDC
jgi:hypothetical protein